MIDAMGDDVRIPCHGEQLAAYVYRPGTTQGDAPCVVMALRVLGDTGRRVTRVREDQPAGFVASCLTTAISALKVRRVR